MNAQPSAAEAITDQSLGLPFEQLNLRFNPFGELPLRDRPELAVVNIDGLVARLHDRCLVLQFMGDKGRGKTTHLLAIRQHFRDAAYVHIPEDQRPAVPQGCPLFIDEVQRLPASQRRRVFRRDVPLVLGTHRDFSRELARAGRRVETIYVHRQLTATRLHLLLTKRIEFARRDEGPIPRITTRSVDRLLAAFGSDVRAMEGRLYDVFQELSEPCDVEV